MADYKIEIKKSAVKELKVLPNSTLLKTSQNQKTHYNHK